MVDCYILQNGVLMVEHLQDQIDSVKYSYVKGNDVYDTVTEGNIQYYQSSKTN